MAHASGWAAASRRAVAVMVGLALTLGLLSCTSAPPTTRPSADRSSVSSPTSASPSATPAVPAATASTGTPRPWDPTMDQLRDVCTGARYPKAPRYARQPPRPAQVLIQDDQTRDYYADRTIGQGESIRPDPAPVVWHDPSLYKVQVVSCASLTSIGTRPVRTCRYGSITYLKLYPATYRIVLYEVRTHRVVTKATMVGQSQRCPLVASTQQARLLSTVSMAQYVKTLGAYITG